jgi:RND family efflux transporter MFP subunit
VAIWKQLLWSLCVAVLVLLLAARLSPVASGFMAGHGLSAPLRLLGLTPAEPAAGAEAAKSAAASGKPAGRKSTVVVQAAASAVINDKITALGTSAALQSVTILPKANGTLTEISLQSGATVTAGQVIARLDSDTEDIARQKAVLAADDARRTLERNRALVQSNAAPASQTQAVELASQVADLAVRVAQQNLDDRAITAPIAGVLGIVKVSVGNAVTPQTQIVTIEDSSALVINFWLPERLSGQVKSGDTASLVPVSRPDVTLTAKITSIDNQIDPASGTFQVQARVANPDGSLRPGMSFTVSMQFAGQSYVTVNPLSVQWGSGGAYVWRMTGDKVDKVPVSVVQRNTETVLVAGDLKEGDAVVTEGLDGLKPGATVQVAGAPVGN